MGKLEVTTLFLPVRGFPGFLLALAGLVVILRTLRRRIRITVVSGRLPS